MSGSSLPLPKVMSSVTAGDLLVSCIEVEIGPFDQQVGIGQRCVSRPAHGRGGDIQIEDIVRGDGEIVVADPGIVAVERHQDVAGGEAGVADIDTGLDQIEAGDLGAGTAHADVDTRDQDVDVVPLVVPSPTPFAV